LLGKESKADDPATWSDYGSAVARVAAGDAAGIGFMLLGSDVGAGDLDHCRDDDTGEIEQWAEELLSEAGAAYCETTVSGRGLRVIGRVHGPELHRRFAFDRNGAGVELYRNTARYITVSGLEIGRCSELPLLDTFLDTLFARYNGDNHRAAGLDFNHIGSPQLTLDGYEAIIRNDVPEGERSEAFARVVWHLARRGWTIDQIVEELAKYPSGIGSKYAGRLHPEVVRCFEKFRAAKQAAAGAATGIPWPQIQFIPGELPRVVNEAEEALLTLGHEIYQRGGLIVRPAVLKFKASDNREAESWQLVPVTRPYLVETLTRAARFLKYDIRSKGFVPIDAPEKVAEAYLARTGRWKLPVLSGITNTPFLRIDGSICEEPGYDAASGLLFKPETQSFPAIPQLPSKADALAALACVQELIATFPFVSTADRAVALSAILTALDRRSMPTAPLHAFTSPVPGSGKSLLVDIASILTTGRPMPVIGQGRSEEELEKRLGAALLGGANAISIDNCDHMLESSFLCQALTQERLSIRVLGLSQNVDTPVNAAICATGNNLALAGDLIRRVILCSLDPQCEHPEERQFERSVIAHAKDHRGALVAAALTALRAWHVSGERSGRPPLGSFEDWSHRVRDPLMWLGCPDPCETMAKIKSDDPIRSALAVVLAQWLENLGIGVAYTVQRVITEASGITEFHIALLTVGASKPGSTLISNVKLGRWLKRVEGRIIDGLVLKQVGINKGYPLWKLEKRS
jgi:hypothetical protein